MAKILVIDDDPDITLIFKKYLEKAGHEITDANTGEQGIEKIHEVKPDLIILDIQMPGKGGLTVANELANKKLKIPFILCTATILNNPIEAYELFIIRHLYAGTLKKPMDLEDITKIVQKGLDLKVALEQEKE